MADPKESQDNGAEPETAALDEAPALDEALVLHEAAALDEALALDDAPESLLGTIVDSKYKLLSIIGKGASSVVFAATDILLERKLAFKLLNKNLCADAQSRERFLQESMTVAALSHPNIIRVLSRGSLAAERLYIVMDFAEGEELSAILARKHSLDTAEFFSIFSQILDGLAYAHEKGIIHRDIKPSNIMVAKSSDEIHAKILDFGIARHLESSSNLAHTAAGVQLGSSAYMSPEQCTGAAVDGRSDLYSLACVMYESLVGAAPFLGGSDMEIMYNQVHKTITHSNRLAKMPVAFRSFLSRAMQKLPPDRFQNASEMKAALLKIEEQTRSTEVKDGRRSSIILVGVLSVCVVAIISFALLHLRSHMKTAAVSAEKKDKINLLVGRIRTPQDMNSFLNQHNQKLSTETKIKVATVWVKIHQVDPPKEYRSTQEIVARFLVGAGQAEEAYEIFDDIQKDPGVPKHKMADLYFAKSTCSRLLLRWQESLKNLNAANDLNGGQDLDLHAFILNGLVECYAQLQEPDNFEKYARQVLALRSKVRYPRVAEPIFALETVLIDQHRVKEAKELAVENQKILNTEPADLWFFKAQNLMALAQCAIAEHQYNDVQEFLKKASQLVANQQAEFSLYKQASLHLANVYFESKHYAESIKIRKQFLSEYIVPLKEFSPFASESLDLANNYGASGQNGLAIKQLQNFLQIWSLSPGAKVKFNASDYVLMQVMLDELRSFLNKEGRHDDFDNLVGATLKALPSRGYERVVWLCAAARSAAENARYKESAEFYQTAFASLPDNPSDSIRLNIKASLALSLGIIGKTQEAHTLITSVETELEKGTVTSSDRIRTLFVAADLEALMGNSKEELKLEHQQLALLRQLRGAVNADNDEIDPSVMPIEQKMGAAYVRLGDLKEGARLFEKSLKAVKEKEKLPATQEMAYVASYAFLGSMYVDLLNYKDCIRCLEQADKLFSLALQKTNRSEFNAEQVKILGNCSISLTKIEDAALKKHDEPNAARARRMLDDLAKYSPQKNRRRQQMPAPV